MRASIRWACLIVGTLGLSAPALGQGKPDERVKGVKLNRVKPNRGSKGRAKAEMKARARNVGEVAPENKGKVDEIKAKVEAKKADKGNKGDKGKPKPNEARGPDTAKSDGAPDVNEGWKGRRRAQQAKANKLLRKGGDDISPAVIQQQRRHAKRVAKLERIRALATDKGDDKTATRAQKLLEKETERFEAWIARRAAKGAKEAAK